MHSEPQRHWGPALRAGARWMINPVSEMGAAQVFRFALNIGEPELFAMREAMRGHPTGRRLLAERPDLGATLADMDRLASLPAGSLGREFHRFMDHPDSVPGYLLTGLIYEGGFFEQLPWDAEMKWVLERVFGTHDMSHVLSGYGADLSGEGLNIFFTLGYMLPDASFRAASLLPFGALVRMSVPPIGRRRWRAHLEEAFERGQALARHQPFSCIAWEELLPLPLEEVRQRVGLKPLRDPDQRSAEWGSTWFMRRIESGQGSFDQDKQRLAAYRAAVEAGVPVRALMGCPMATRVRIGEMALSGASRSELMEQVRPAPQAAAA